MTEPCTYPAHPEIECLNFENKMGTLLSGKLDRIRNETWTLDRRYRCWMKVLAAGHHCHVPPAWRFFEVACIV